MLNWIDSHKSKIPVSVKLNFGCKCLSADPYTGRLVYDKHNVIQSSTYDLIVGADGARSVFKNAITSQSSISYEGYDMKTRWKFVPIDINGNPAFIGASGFFGIDGK